MAEFDQVRTAVQTILEANQAVLNGLSNENAEALGRAVQVMGRIFVPSTSVK